LIVAIIRCKKDAIYACLLKSVNMEVWREMLERSFVDFPSKSWIEGISSCIIKCLSIVDARNPKDKDVTPHKKDA
jgi:hypothetical protein